MKTICEVGVFSDEVLSGRMIEYRCFSCGFVATEQTDVSISEQAHQHILLAHPERLTSRYS